MNGSTATGVEGFVVRGELVSVQRSKGTVRLSAPGEWLQRHTQEEIHKFFLESDPGLVLRGRNGIDLGKFVPHRVQIETSTHAGEEPVIILYGSIDPKPGIHSLTLGAVVGQYADKTPFHPPINYLPGARKSVRSWKHPVDGKEMLLVDWDYAIFGQANRANQDNYNPYFFERDPSINTRVPAFYMDKTEVTNREYHRFCQQTGHPIPPSWRRTGSYNPGEDDLPFEEATYGDAQAYANWTGKRLPTEIEWEMAARGGMSKLLDGSGPGSLRNSPPVYPTGNDFDPIKCNTIESGRNRLLSVYNLQDTGPYGHVGLCGNAREWTSSFYSPYPGHQFRGESSFLTGTQFRVIRGGSYHQNQTMARSDSRDYGGFPTPEEDRSAGFRLVYNP